MVSQQLQCYLATPIVSIEMSSLKLRYKIPEIDLSIPTLTSIVITKQVYNDKPMYLVFKSLLYADFFANFFVCFIPCTHMNDCRISNSNSTQPDDGDDDGDNGGYGDNDYGDKEDNSGDDGNNSTNYNNGGDDDR